MFFAYFFMRKTFLHYISLWFPYKHISPALLHRFLMTGFLMLYLSNGLYFTDLFLEIAMRACGFCISPSPLCITPMGSLWKGRYVLFLKPVLWQGAISRLRVVEIAGLLSKIFLPKNFVNGPARWSKQGLHIKRTSALESGIHRGDAEGEGEGTPTTPIATSPENNHGL